MERHSKKLTESEELMLIGLPLSHKVPVVAKRLVLKMYLLLVNITKETRVLIRMTMRQEVAPTCISVAFVMDRAKTCLIRLGTVANQKTTRALHAKYFKN